MKENRKITQHVNRLDLETRGTLTESFCFTNSLDTDMIFPHTGAVAAANIVKIAFWWSLTSQHISQLQYLLLESSGFNLIFVCQLCDVLSFHRKKVSYMIYDITLLHKLTLGAVKTHLVISSCILLMFLDLGHIFSCNLTPFVHDHESLWR